MRISNLTLFGQHGLASAPARRSAPFGSCAFFGFRAMVATMKATMSVALVALIGATALASCTSPPSPDPSSTFRATVISTMDAEPDFVPANGYSGELTLSATGCWQIGELATVFPSGTVVQEDGSGIVLADGSEVHEGESIAGSATLVDRTKVPDLVLPEACEGGELLFIFPGI